MPFHKCPTCGTERVLSEKVLGRKFRCSVCRAKVRYGEDGRLELLEPGQADPRAERPSDEVPTNPLDPTAEVGPVPAALDRMDGRTVGHYRLLRLIGKGRDSRVYLGEHVALKRKAAVKLLSAETASTPEQKAKRANEAAILAKIEHPNVVRVYDFGFEGDLPYIAMEHVEGMSLWDRVRTQGALAPAAWAELALDVFQGLDAVHGTGLLHRDVKPGNILLGTEGPAKLVDFGLAAEVREAQGPRAGRLVGTPGYLAPETVAGQPADARSDLYSAGGALYYAATGRVPFAGRSPREILQKQLEGPPPAPRSLAPRFPEAYEKLLLALLSQEPARRPASAAEAIKALAASGAGLPLRVREKKRIVVVRSRGGLLGVLVALAAAAVLAVLILVLGRSRAPSPPAAGEPAAVVAPPVEPPPSPPAPEKAPPAVEAPPAPDPVPAHATASVLALRQGSHLAGLVEFDGERYVIRTDDGRYVLEKGEVVRWYRSSQEMAAEAGPRLEEARRLYGLAKAAAEPGDRAALVKEAIHQAEGARDGFASARRYFSGPPDAWLDDRMRETFELLRLVRDVEAAKAAEAPPAAEPTPPPAEAPAPVDVPAAKKAPEGKPGRLLPPSVRDGLLWLGRHQGADGRWTVAGYVARCERPEDRCTANPGHADYDVGVTALAMLSILGAGIGLDDQDAYEGVNLGECLRRGAEALLRAQDASGLIGSATIQKHMYNHAMATHALAEAVRSIPADPESAERSRLRKAVQDAADFLLLAQNPGRGWRYRRRSGDNDTSVTAFSVLALDAVKRAGLTVGEAGFRGALAWFDEVTEVSHGRAGYTHKGTGKVFVPGHNEHFEHKEGLTAAAETCRQILSPRGSPAARALILRDLPAWNGLSIDVYYWYYGTRALRNGGEPAEWNPWKKSVLEALEKNQNARKEGCRRGSWEPVDRWSSEGGRVYVTALGVLTLEYALLPKPFPFRAPGPAPQLNAAPARWEFVLKSGGKLKAISYEERGDKYLLKLAAGTVAVAKADVQAIKPLE